MNYAPIVINDRGRVVVRLARYHCRQVGKPPSIDRQFPGLYNAGRDNLEKFWREQFSYHHALMLVESFFENVERDGRNAVLHFVPRPATTMLIACLHSEWVDPGDGKTLLSFAAITDEPPSEVRDAGHDRMIREHPSAKHRTMARAGGPASRGAPGNTKRSPDALLRARRDSGLGQVD